MLASGGAELVSLGAVLPFLAVLTDPERLWQQKLIQALAVRAGFTEASELLLPATLAFVVAALLASLIRMTNLWLNVRLAAAIGSDLSCEAYRRTLYQPYSIHLQRNSAELITGCTTDIGGTVVALTSLLQLITAAVVTLGLFTGLLVIDWAVALGGAVLFGSMYSLLAITARRELRLNSELIVSCETKKIKALQEGLGAIRDVLLDGNQRTYVEIYRQADRLQRQRQAKNRFISVFPRYAVEVMGLVAIALLGWLLVVQIGSGAPVVPLLGALALGAQRLLPALQQIYSGWANLKSANPHIKSVVEMLNQTLPKQVVVSEPLFLRSNISLEAVHFRYLAEQPEVLRGLDLEIRCGEIIGLIGSTGSGKSTLVDLFMGLLEPSQGRILVDGMDLHDPSHPERLAAWRAAITHVPQSIYLADTSIAENIAFGVPKDKIDIERVRYAAEHAQIASFIEAHRDGYNTFVGERGIRLSGGQRQRIAIARALYKQAKVIVLDEATSALDTATEDALMVALAVVSRRLTVVMIAHRLSTLACCDRVIQLHNGNIVTGKLPSRPR